MSRAKSAFWGSVSSQLFMIISMLLSIIITPLILKFLNKEEYGFYTILFQIVGYLTMLDFGLGGAIARFLAANRGEEDSSKLAINKIISTSFFTYSVLGALVILAGFCLTPLIPQFINMGPDLGDVAVSITLTLSVFVGLQFPLRVFSSIFYAHQKQLLSNIMGFTISFLNSTLPVLFLYLNQGLWSFVYTNIICSILSIIVTFMLMRKFYSFLRIRISYFDKSLLGQLFSFGFFLFLNAVASQVVFFTDRFFIGSFVSLSAVAIYSLTAKAPELSRELIYRITDNAYPAMVEINSREGENRLKSIHQKLLLITVCFIGIAFWMIFIINDWFLTLWVGDGFFAGQLILVLTLLIMLQHTIIHVGAICLQGAGLVKGFSLMSIIEAALNLGLTLVLARMYGVKGILLATIIAGWATSGWYIPLTTLKYLKISLMEYLLKPIIIPLLTISSLGMVLYWLSKNIFEIFDLTWVNFIVVTFFLGIMFAAFVWIAFLRKEFSNYIPIRFKKYLFVG